MVRKSFWKRGMSAALALALVFTLMLTPALASIEPDGDILDPAAETAEIPERTETIKETSAPEDAEEEPEGDAGISSDTAPAEEIPEPEDMSEPEGSEEDAVFLSLSSGEPDEEDGLQMLDADADNVVTIWETGAGYGSVQDAVDAVKESGKEQTVVLNADMKEDVEIESGTKITLDLNGYTLKGSGTTSVITIDEGGSLTLADGSTEKTGTVTGGSAEFGGGVYNSGTFTMTGGTISGNTAGEGGGVENWGGTLILDGGEISDNTAKTNGGGVFSYLGNVTVSGGTISGNTASSYGGGVYNFLSMFTMEDGEISDNAAYSEGGGVLNYLGKITMTDGAISGNKADYGGGVENAYGPFLMEGGAISDNTAYTDGGGVYSDDGTFTMTGGTISGNTAEHYGGGVCNDSEIDSEYVGFTMTGGEISDNTAEYGGGVYVAVGVTFTMTGGEISDKNSANYGGGVYNAGTFEMKASEDSEGSADGDGGEISGNTAEEGGGVYSYYGEFTMSDGEISGNEAETAGGGVENWYGTIVMDGGTISDNTAREGGGVLSSYGEFTMTGGAISGNTAEDLGGGVETGYEIFIMEGGEISGNTSEYAGGGVENWGGTFIIDGGEISGNTADEEGGGVEIVYGGTLTLKTGEISDNTADYGGGVLNYYGEFTMTGGEISGNTAKVQGGGVEIVYGPFIMEGGEISGNDAYTGGGVITGYDTFTMSGGEISGNTAEYIGGGVEIVYGPFIMEGGEISGNTAEYAGGVINCGTFTMSGGEISGNSAYNSGGGVYNNNDSEFTMTGGVLYSNTAGSSGADFQNEDGTATLISASEMDTEKAEILGWFSDDPDARYAEATDSQPVTVLDITEDVGMIVAYEITVTYALEDGTEPETVTINPSKGDTVTVSDGSGMEFSDDVCYLKAWNTEKDGTGETYKLGETAVFTKNTVLYAQTEGHNWAGLDSKQPTCTENGETTFTCQNQGCDASYTEKTGTLGGHIWDPDADDTEVDWIEDGDGNIIGCVVTLTCQRVETGWNYYICGQTMTIECEVTAVTTEATCTEDGEIVYTAVGSAIDEYSGEEVTVEVSKTEVIYATDHEWASMIAKDPTCTEDGTMSYFCLNCDESYTEPIAALGHIWDQDADDTVVEWGEDGDGNVTCTVTLTCQRVGAAWSGGKACGQTLTIECEVTPEITKDATCTEDGEVVYTAVGSAIDEYSGEEVTVEVSKTEVIYATDHEWVGMISKDPTCTEEGTTSYECQNCDESYTEPIAALGHIWDQDADDTVVEWGEDEDGNVTCTVTLTCQRVGAAWSGGKACGETLTIECEVTAEITDPTCTDEGKVVYTAVGSASDENGDVAKTVAVEETMTETIAALGHSWDPDAEDTVVEWGEDGDGNVTCTVTLFCQNSEGDYFCGETLTIECEVTADITDPTCTDEGKVVYTAVGSAMDENGDVAQTVYVEETMTETIAALGHDWDEGTETKAPTCTDDGEMTYTCSRCKETRTETIAALGHSWDPDADDTVVEWGEDGDGNVICTVTLFCQNSEGDYFCGETLTIECEVTAEITDPTCTDEGKAVYTAVGSASDENGDVAQTVAVEETMTETIAALGHDWDEGTETKAPTCTDEGEMTYTCSRCEETRTETIAALGHDYVEEVIAPTCTEDGYTIHTCSRGDDTYTDDHTEALGHDWVETDIVSGEGIDRSETDIHMECSRCGETMDEIVVEETVSTDIEAHSTIEWSDLITAEELDALFEDGAEIDFDLVVAALAEIDVPAEDAALVEGLLNGQEYAVLYLDIQAIMDILHADGTEETVSYEETLNPITITVVIPEELLEAEGDTYVVIRVHDGEAEELETVEEDGTLTFSSDKFSTYAIVKLAAETEEGSGSGDEPSGPDTGDSGSGSESGGSDTGDSGSGSGSESGGSDTGDSGSGSGSEGGGSDTGDSGSGSGSESGGSDTGDSGSGSGSESGGSGTGDSGSGSGSDTGETGTGDNEDETGSGSDTSDNEDETDSGSGSSGNEGNKSPGITVGEPDDDHMTIEVGEDGNIVIEVTGIGTDGTAVTVTDEEGNVIEIEVEIEGNGKTGPDAAVKITISAEALAELESGTYNVNVTGTAGSDVISVNAAFSVGGSDEEDAGGQVSGSNEDETGTGSGGNAPGGDSGSGSGGNAPGEGSDNGTGSDNAAPDDGSDSSSSDEMGSSSSGSNGMGSSGSGSSMGGSGSSGSSGSASGETTTPQTGDTGTAALFAVMLLMCGLALAGILLRRRRNIIDRND